MAKKMKKVDVKKVTKLQVSAQIAELFENMGVGVGSADAYGFTEGTLVLKLGKCDVQVKLITPKAGLDRYESLEEEEEEEIVIQCDDELETTEK